MKVIIKGREYTYESDYPVGWKFMAGDNFKSPVVIGGNPCFIKRFERQNPADISGWQLLQQLKNVDGEFERVPFPCLYDIVSTNEKARPVYYTFYEYLEGRTLNERLTKYEQIDLLKLTDDLFRALDAIHGYEHWFADFTEKNIFYAEADDRFLLIDLDSAQPFSKVPQHDMDGDKAYWALVLRFYKEVVGYKQLKLAELPGPVLNYLQVIFLILRLKLYAKDLRQAYQSSTLYDNLGANLNAISPVFRDLFSKALQDSRQLGNYAWKKEIQEAIRQKIIAGTSCPVIKQFRTSVAEVKVGDYFTLSWDVEHATKLKLYRNGAPNKEVRVGDTSINLPATFDGRSGEVRYALRATNVSGEVESEPVYIKIKYKEDSQPVPEIVSFESNTSEIKNGDTFTLSWKVEQAKSLKLYKNGAFHKDLPESNNYLEIKEVNDGKPKVNVYTLYASNDSVVVESSPLSIRITDPPKPTEPEIKLFKSNASQVKNGETVRFNWQVENAASYKIKRNGIVQQELSADANTLETVVAFTGKEKEVIYTLLAANNFMSKESEPVAIKLKNNFPIPFPVAALGVVLLVALGYFFFANKKEVTATNLVSSSVFSEGKSVVITGNNFPTDSNEVQVLFNSTKGKILNYAPDSLNIQVPQLGKQFGNGRVQVALVVNDATIRTWDTLFVRNISISETFISAGKPLSVVGNYFSSATNNIKVLFNNLESRVVNYGGDTLKVIVPNIPVTPQGNTVKVGVVIQGDTTYVTQELIMRSIRLSRSTVLVGNSLIITGSHFPVNRRTIQVLFDDVRARITRNSESSLTVIVPRMEMGKNGQINNVKVAVLIEGDTITAPGNLIVRRQNTRIPFDPPPRVTPTTYRNIAEFIQKELQVSSNIAGGNNLRNLNTITLRVKNNSDYAVDKVFVDITYRRNRREYRKNYVLSNVLAKNISRIELPVSDFGTDAERNNIAILNITIVNVHSRQLATAIIP